MNRNFKELILAGVISVSIVLGATAALAVSPDPVDAPSVTSAQSAQPSTVERQLQIEKSKIDGFAKAYEAHLVKTWVDNTNWNLWMGKAVEFEAAQAAATRAAELERAERVERQTTVTSATPVGTGQCGGNLPPCCVMQRESGGSLTAKNPSSSASGKWQFLNGTWNGYGGYAEAWMAPESVQDAKAAELWAGGSGASHWGGGC